ncbi:MAG TPA: inorganic diphosphatase [Verrucomicrobiae bacterium]|nr:inorganic diphosphatase [Verrucomicrobiae bacterium]
MNFIALPIGSRAPEVVNAVVEIPRGESNKYEYDKSLQVFRLDRPLYSSVHYPCDYGFIPSTLGSDGDTLDILILVDRPSFTGCLVEVRPVGMLNMLDRGVSDQKILAVGVNDPEHNQIHDYRDIYPHVLREIENFFSIYKVLEGKRTEVTGWRNPAHAHKLILKSHRRFVESQKSA